MFDNISAKYDLLNHLLSFNIDKLWRRRVVKISSAKKPDKALDVATGTADLAIALRKTGAREIIGADISQGMLDIGHEKIRRKNLDDLVKLQLADSEELPYDDNYFDLITVAFGVRNFENLDRGLGEMRRVLKPGGTLLILEFSQPTGTPFKQLYRFYSKNILPLLGKLVSKDASAYTYLPESVDAFPYGDAFVEHLKNVGFAENRFEPLTFGIATIYESKK